MYKLPERGGGGGEVIWAMPERKHSFLHEDEDDSFGQADDLIVECDMRGGTPPKNLKNTTDPINALRQPEVEHRFHFLNHGTVSIIQIRLTCLSWISAMLQCINSQGLTRVHTGSIV